MDTIGVKSNETLSELKMHLVKVYEGDPWYGNSISKVLDSIHPKLAFRSPGYGMHSAAELLAHMISWREFVIQRLIENKGSVPNQEQTFNWKRFSHRKSQAWELLLNELNSSQTNLIALIDRQDDSILKKEVAGKSYTFRHLLNGVLHHDLYHIGQIAYIQKLISKKGNPVSGIMNYSYRVFPYESLAKQK